MRELSRVSGGERVQDLRQVFERAGMKQKQRRQKDLRQARAAQLPPLEQIIALLVEIIRRPQSTPRQWADAGYCRLLSIMSVASRHNVSVSCSKCAHLEQSLVAVLPFDDELD
jgi:hypothetical protein